MTQKFFVGSKSLAIVVEVEGTGTTQTDARRDAVNCARGLHRIVDPVALVDNHRSATIVRGIAEQKRLQLIRSIRESLSRNSSSLRQRREDTRYRN